MWQQLLITAFLLCFYPCFSLPYKKDSGVINLTKKDFVEKVFGSEHVWLVEFYAPYSIGCGHCKKLAPEWEKAAKNLDGIIKVAAVNCDEERELAGHFGIQGFPTIKLFPSQAQLSPDKKGLIKVPEDYQGPRTAAAIANFALSKLPSFVTSVTSKSEEKFLSSEPQLAKVILFTNKKQTTNLYKALSIDFHYQLVLGEVRDTEKELVSKYGIEKYPTLLVITPDGQQVKYDGELNYKSLFKFLKPYAKEIEGKQQQQQQQQKQQTPPPPPEPVHPVREQVNDQKTFESVCFNTNKNCIITFLDPWNTEPEVHEKYIAMLEKLQEKQGKFYKFIWMNGAKNPQFADTWGLASVYPSTVLFNHKTSSIIPYRGSFNEESLKDFLDKIIVGSLRASPVSKIPTVNEAPDPEPFVPEEEPVEEPETASNEGDSKDEL